MLLAVRGRCQSLVCVRTARAEISAVVACSKNALNWAGGGVSLFFKSVGIFRHFIRNVLLREILFLQEGI